MSDAASRVLDRAALLARYGRPRSGIVVFTNGVFDLLHRGHVDYLERARALGDALVVAVNDDASARRLGKGPDRPLNRGADRAYVVAGLACVDAVCLFGEDTPRELVADLLPDVLVKGGDYRVEDVAGREEVEAVGGRVELIPFVTGYSTTSLVEKIRAEGREE